MVQLFYIYREVSKKNTFLMYGENQHHANKEKIISHQINLEKDKPTQLEKTCQKKYYMTQI